MDHRRFFAQVIAAVLAGERIHRVRPQLAAPRSFRHRFLNGALHLDLIHAHRCVHQKRRHAGILADRTLILLRHIDIGCDNPERLRRLGPGSFVFYR